MEIHLLIAFFMAPVTAIQTPPCKIVLMISPQAYQIPYKVGSFTMAGDGKYG
jgi:hypothetical protein